MKILILLVLIISLKLNTSADNLVFGVEALDYEPFYLGKGRVYNGLSQEILDAFAKEKGHVIVYNSVKIDQLYDKFLTKQVDFKYPDNPLWNSDNKKGKEIFYSEPIITTKMGVNVTGAKDSIKKVGIVAGFTPWIILDEIKSGKLEIVEKNSMQQLVSMAINGEIDAIYGSEDVVNFHASALNQKFSLSSKFKTDTDIFHVSGYDQKIINEISTWLRANKDKVNQITKKYIK